MNNNLVLTMLLRPLLLVLFLGLIVWPIKWCLGKLIPDGRVKRFLWRRLN
jgi:hypothetical protein